MMSFVTNNIEGNLKGKNPLDGTFPLGEEKKVPSLENLAARVLVKDPNFIEKSKDLSTPHQIILYSNLRGLENRLRFAKECSENNSEFAQYFQTACGDVVKKLKLPEDEKKSVEVLYRHIYNIGTDDSVVGNFSPQVSLPKSRRMRILFERSLVKSGSRKAQEVAEWASLVLGTASLGFSFFYGTSVFFNMIADYAAPSLLQTVGFGLVTKSIAIVPGLFGAGGGLRIGEAVANKINALQEAFVILGKSEEKKREEREFLAVKEEISNIWLQDVLPRSSKGSSDV